MSDEKKIALVSQEAEMGLAGAMLMEPYRVIPMARDGYKLDPGAFGTPPCRILVKVMYDMLNDDKVRDINFVTVRDRLETLGISGGRNAEVPVDYLVECVDAGVPAQAESYCDLVRQKFILREVIRAADEIKADARVAKRGDVLLKNVPERFMQIVDDVLLDESNSAVLEKVIEGYRMASEDENYLPGMRSGWRVMDDVANGLEDGTMIIIAGLPGQGKTTLEDQIACHVAEHYGPVARVTIDMTRKDLLERALCRLSGVSMPKLRRGYVKVGSAQWDQVCSHKELVQDFPLKILEGETNLNAILTWIRMMKMKHDIKLFTVDYIQQIYTGEPGTDANENVRLTKVSSELKRLCMSLKIPGIVLSQLSRGSARDNRPPQLHDLRGSGSIEQDASMVMVTYKNQNEELSTKNMRAQYVDILKNKNGQTGQMAFWFHAPYFRHEALPGGMDHEDEGVRPRYKGNDMDAKAGSDGKEDKKEDEVDLAF